MNHAIRKARLAGGIARRWVSTALAWMTQRARSAWSAHSRLIDTNAAYATALAAGAASVVREIRLESFLVALVSAGLAVYVAVRGRSRTWGRWLSGPSRERDDWDNDERRDVRLFRAPRWDSH